MGINSSLSDPYVGNRHRSDQRKMTASIKMCSERTHYKYPLVEHTTTHTAIKLFAKHLQWYHEEIITDHSAWHLILHSNEVKLRLSIQY